MESIASETLTNTDMFYARDAAAQIVALFKSFAHHAATEAEPISDLPN